MADDPLGRLDDPDYPALTMSQAAELLGVQAAFLRSLDGSGVLQPYRSRGGHRRYSRSQLELAARMRTLVDDGHSLASAETIVNLQDQLADARTDNGDRARWGAPPLPDLPVNPGRIQTQSSPGVHGPPGPIDGDRLPR